VPLLERFGEPRELASAGLMLDIDGGQVQSIQLLFSLLFFFLLSPARGRGWVRGLQTVFETPSPHLSP
jgi:hypothetical protein